MTAVTLNDLPIWLINLPGSRARRLRMQRQLSRFGLNAQLQEAVDGRANWDTLRHTVDIPTFERNVGRKIMKGEIGCYHSHLKVWKELQQSGAPVGLVLEDDVVFRDNFLPAIDAALNVTDQWDVLKLNQVRAKFPIRKTRISDWHLTAFLGSFTGTGAYLIKADCARHLSETFLPIVRPIDHEIDRNHVHNIRHLGLTPFPSYVCDGGRSTITGRNCAGMEKFPKLQRLNVYSGRMRNLFGKSAFILGR